MRFLVVFILIIFNLAPANADFITSSSTPYFGSFPSARLNNNFVTTSPFNRNNSFYSYPNNWNNNPYRYNTYNNPQTNFYRKNLPHKHHPYVKRHMNPYGAYSHPVNNLNALEKYALKRSYPRESEIRRLERLESLAFGAIQTGDMQTRYKNVEAAILSRPQNNYKNSIWRTIGNYFAGQTTGITPSIIGQDLTGYSYSPNSSYYSAPGVNNEVVEEYSNGLFGGGYRVFNNNMGSCGGVHILD